LENSGTARRKQYLRVKVERGGALNSRMLNCARESPCQPVVHPPLVVLALLVVHPPLDVVALASTSSCRFSSLRYNSLAAIRAGNADGASQVSRGVATTAVA